MLAESTDSVIRAERNAFRHGTLCCGHFANGSAAGTLRYTTGTIGVIALVPLSPD